MPLVPVLADIELPDIRRNVASDAQKTAQANYERHSLHGYQPARRAKKTEIKKKLFEINFGAQNIP